MCVEDLKTWAPVLSAVAAAAAAIAAWRNVVLTNKNARRTRALDLLYKKEQEFETPRMRRTRVRAATALTDGVTESAAIDEVLNYFEALARMVVDEDVDASLAWHNLYYWFVPYFYATQDIRRKEREKDKSVWASIDQMLPYMIAMQRANGTQTADVSPDAQAKFFAEEVALDCS